MEKIKAKHLNVFSINDIPLKKIGDFIKEARTTRNQTTFELASDLKISEQQLKAIEEGREDLLPEKVFIKAMVKRISEKLKIDTSLIEGEFENKKEEIQIQKVEKIVEEVSKDKQSNEKQSLTFFLTIFISGLIGLMSSSFIFNLFYDLNYESQNKVLINKS